MNLKNFFVGSIVFTALFAATTSFAATDDLARKQMEVEDNSMAGQLIIDLFQEEMAKPDSKLSIAIKEKFKDLHLIEPVASDVSLIQGGHSGGDTSWHYLLPLRYAYKSNTFTLAYLAVGYGSSNHYGSDGKTYIHIGNFVNVQIDR